MIDAIGLQVIEDLVDVPHIVLLNEHIEGRPALEVDHEGNVHARNQLLLLVVVLVADAVQGVEDRAVLLQEVQHCAALRQYVVDQAPYLVFVHLRDLQLARPELLQEAPVEECETLVHDVTVKFIILRSLVVYSEKPRVKIGWFFVSCSLIELCIKESSLLIKLVLSL